MAYTNYNLKSCPFCAADVKEGGSSPFSHDPHRKQNFSIACSCGAFGPKEAGIDKAIMAWNTRAYPGLELLWNPFDFQEVTDLADIKGNLKSLAFTSILQMLSSENKTGILQLSQGQKNCAICLKDGQVIAATSNYGKQLGQILMDKGLVSQERLQEVLDKAKKSGKRLGEMLLDMDFICQDTLRDVIRQQISETIQGLILWEAGIFQYRDCLIEFDERGIEDISIMGMMLDALRVSDEVTAAEAIKTTAEEEIICDLEELIEICGD